jgi:hypothetical protein
MKVWLTGLTRAPAVSAAIDDRPAFAADTVGGMANRRRYRNHARLSHKSTARRTGPFHCD